MRTLLLVITLATSPASTVSRVVEAGFCEQAVRDFWGAMMLRGPKWLFEDDSDGSITPITGMTCSPVGNMAGEPTS